MTMTDLWILAPLLILAGAALLVLLLGAIIPGRFVTAVAVAAALAAALWELPAPPAQLAPTLGLAATPFARFFTVLFSLTAAATLLLGHDYNKRRRITGEEYPATILFAAFGMAALSAAVNLLTFFLGLEALTFAFYILVAVDLRDSRSAEAGVKYLLIGAVAAAFIAFGIALIYCATGTLDIAAAMGGSAAGGGLAVAGWGLLLTGLAFKMSLVPAHLWTPDVYQGGPTPVIAFLATASKGAAVAALLLLLVKLGPAPFTATPLRLLSLLSMVVGNFAALRQEEVKRMLAYSAVGQMGYVALALATTTSAGYQAAAFYVAVYTAMNLAAFGALALLDDGSGPKLCAELRGLGYRHPFRAAVLALAMFALAGVPPTGGFTGKFLIFAAALRGEEVPLAVVGILTAALSAYFYLRVVVALYLQPAGVERPAPRLALPAAFTLAAAAIAIVAGGLFPAPLLELVAVILS